VVDHRSKTQLTIIAGLIALVASISTAGTSIIVKLIDKPATSAQAENLNRQLDAFERLRLEDKVQRKEDLNSVRERQNEIREMILNLEIPPPEVRLLFEQNDKRMTAIEQGLHRNWAADRKHREDEKIHITKDHPH